MSDGPRAILKMPNGTFRSRLVACAALASAAFLLSGSAGCGPGSNAESELTPEHIQQLGVSAAIVQEGKIAYGLYCAGCHGVQGDGKGPAAAFLHPTPRNFETANFKFGSTRSGLLPTDDDLKRSITNGLKGSAMPGWSLLPERTVDALVAYIKTLSPKWRKRRPASDIPLVNDPYRSRTDLTEVIQRGEVVYHGFATCWTCHPSYVPEKRINEHLVAMENPTRDTFRPSLFESDGKPNVEGEMAYPPDFKRDFVRAGLDVGDLYRSIAAGITGTAMPTWIDSMSFSNSQGRVLVEPSDIWAVSYYVRSLIQQRPPRLTVGAFNVRDRAEPIYLHTERPILTDEPAAGIGEEFLDEDAEEFSEDD